MITKDATIEKVWNWLYELWNKHALEIADPNEPNNAFTVGGAFGLVVGGKTFLISIKEVKS